VINDRFEQAIDDLQAIVEKPRQALGCPAPGSGAFGGAAWA